MKVKIFPSLISGSIHVPAGKSMMQRICALALMNRGEVEISNPGNSKDDKAALKIIEDCGASIKRSGDKLLIQSDGMIRPPAKIHVGESGLSARMFTPILSLSQNEFTVTGEGSLLHRPLAVMIDILNQLDVNVTSNLNKLPLIVRGPLQVRSLSVDGSKSSQNLTGLLFAFCYAAKETVIIDVHDLVSKRYVDLSIQLLTNFGYNVAHLNYKQIVINPVERKVRNLNVEVEGDWSSASFLLVAGCIAGEVKLSGLNRNSIQADRQVMEVLKLSNAEVNDDNGILTIRSSNKLQSFSFDATDCPDLFPPLAVLAAYSNGISSIKGVHRLREKESDRALALETELKKMGVILTIEDDCLLIHGNGSLQGANVDAHHDHRIAMALAVAALGANGATIISGAESVGKSFPSFFEVLKQLNADVNLIEDGI